MITKRQLGFCFILLGFALAIGILSTDFLGAGNYDGIGPMQRLGLSGTAIMILVGLSLIPLGERPA